MTDATKTSDTQKNSGLRIPGFAQLQRLGKSLMLPIAVLPGRASCCAWASPTSWAASRLR